MPRSASAARSVPRSIPTIAVTRTTERSRSLRGLILHVANEPNAKVARTSGRRRQTTMKRNPDRYKHDAFYDAQSRSSHER